MRQLWQVAIPGCGIVVRSLAASLKMSGNNSMSLRLFIAVSINLIIFRCVTILAHWSCSIPFFVVYMEFFVIFIFYKTHFRLHPMKAYCRDLSTLLSYTALNCTVGIN